MSTNPFISTDISIKRICKGVCIFLPCLIMMLVIGSYYFHLIDNTLRDHYTTEKVLGVENISNIYSGYASGADMFVTGDWRPEGYISIDRSIDNPIYDVKAGSIVKDTLEVGNDNILFLQCDEITQEALDIPPYWPKCSVKLNDVLISDNVRSDVYCDQYGFSKGKSSNCKETVGLVYYKDKNLTNGYLFLSSGDYVGSPYGAMAYELKDSSYTRLYFDFRDYILEDQYIRGGLDSESLYLAFTDDTKKEFRLITREYDPSMSLENISEVYYEWNIKSNRLSLYKKIVVKYE